MTGEEAKTFEAYVEAKKVHETVAEGEWLAGQLRGLADETSAAAVALQARCLERSFVEDTSVDQGNIQTIRECFQDHEGRRLIDEYKRVYFIFAEHQEMKDEEDGDAERTNLTERTQAIAFQVCLDAINSSAGMKMDSVIRVGTKRALEDNREKCRVGFQGTGSILNVLWWLDLSNTGDNNLGIEDITALINSPDHRCVNRVIVTADAKRPDIEQFRDEQSNLAVRQQMCREKVRMVLRAEESGEASIGGRIDMTQFRAEQNAARDGLRAWPPTAEIIAAYKARLNKQDIMDVFVRLLLTDTPE